MSGHSKWSTIKRKKGMADAKRGAIFTKLGKLIAVAAREKGGDLNTNFTLRMALDKARSANMPKDTIERAIKRGTGELECEQIIELIYEGIGPANSQFIVRALTDNKNRSAASIRHAFTKYGGSLGSVMWNFEQKGVFRITNDEFSAQGGPASGWKLMNDEDELELIETGVDDIVREDEGVTLFINPKDLQKVKKYLEEKNITTESAEIEYVAKDEVNANDEDKEKIKKFIEELENNEDVADYYTNVNI